MALIVLAVLTALPGLAEPPLLPLSEYQKQIWQVEDGLPENNVRMIAQQSDGKLLLATAAGLATFDGLHFQSFSISASIDGEAVNAMLHTRNGDLWIGTDGQGVLQLTASGALNNISELAGLSNERIRTFHEDADGGVWIATQNGIEHYSNGSLKVLSGAGQISGDIATPFADDGHGGLFFITSRGLFHLNGKDWKPYQLHHAEMGKPVAVYRDPQQRLWVGTMLGVVQLVPRSDGGYDEVIAARISSPVTVMVGDRLGNLWVGTRHDGVRRIYGKTVDSWNSRDGLADDAVCALFVDNEENLWIGSQTGGLTRLSKAAFASYSGIEGYPVTIAANVLADSHGDLWFGTWGKGIFRLHDGRLKNETPPGMPSTALVRTLSENARGQIWIGTWFNGIYRYDGNSYQHYLLGTESPANAVSATLVDRRGGLWVGTYIGVLYFADGVPQAKRETFLPGKLVTCLLEDTDGSVLVGTSTGLFRVREGRVMPVSDLPHPHVLALLHDSLGYTWVSTKAGGLSLLKDDQVYTLSARSGMPSTPIQTLIEDGKGYLWLGTLRGIARVNVAGLHAVADGGEASLSAILFGRDDGMQSSECVGSSLPASTITSDGTLWFVTAKGFVHTTGVNEEERFRHPLKPVVEWTLNGDGDRTLAHDGAQIHVGASQPDLSFFFSVTELTNPSQVEFRYRLVGFDSDWIRTRSRNVRYRRLPPGNYRFEVQARRSGEAWGATVSSIAVEQGRHFYETWMFYACLLLIGAVLAVQFFRSRLKLVKGQIGVVMEERNRIARECHDTLMAGLAAISWQLEATAKLLRDSSSAETPAVESFKVARSMVSHCQAEARRIIWDLRDTEEMTNVLSQALSRTIAAHDPGDSVAVSFRVEGEEVPMAPAYVHHLVCIGQEAVSNAMRHAAPSHVAVNLRYEANALYLSIRDDGCGFRGDSLKVGHFGIHVMEERARKVGGVLRVQSSNGGGTEVSVNVMFKAMQAVNPRQPYVTPWIGI
ncbi:two-component regulator propeller domain-containing protein [Silvibacterium acidisoli]|uniref:two-component regulator propeller domain-containing protein n=1 Tax=Acidobacteriaceae bacterium ZG23-2 TaxID=2883246 RepID=UPI00406D2607